MSNGTLRGITVPLDDEHSRFTQRVRHVLRTDARVEDVPDMQSYDRFFTIFPIVHVDRPVEHHKHLFAIVDVPMVGFVSPMQSRGDTVHVRDR